jgi:hypothetical protein
MELRPFWEKASCTATQEFPNILWTPRDLLPCSQEPSTCPCPQSDQANPYHPHPIYLKSILILSTHLSLGFPSGLFPSGFPTRILFLVLVAQLLRKFPIFYDAQKFIPHLLRCPKIHYHAYKSPPQVLTLSQMNLDNLSHLIFLRSSLVLSFHICLGLASGHFPWGFPTKWS